MAERVNLYIDQGTTFSTEIEVFQSNENLNVDDFNFYSSIKKLYSSLISADFFITKDANTNSIQLSMDREITGDLVPGKYLYDVLKVDTSTGASSKVQEGLVFVIETMTRTANT